MRAQHALIYHLIQVPDIIYDKLINSAMNCHFLFLMYLFVTLYLRENVNLRIIGSVEEVVEDSTI